MQHAFLLPTQRCDGPMHPCVPAVPPAGHKPARLGHAGSPTAPAACLRQRRGGRRPNRTYQAQADDSKSASISTRCCLRIQPLRGLGAARRWEGWPEAARRRGCVRAAERLAAPGCSPPVSMPSCSRLRSATSPSSSRWASRKRMMSAGRREAGRREAGRRPAGPESARRMFGASARRLPDSCHASNPSHGGRRSAGQVLCLRLSPPLWQHSSGPGAHPSPYTHTHASSPPAPARRRPRLACLADHVGDLSVRVKHRQAVHNLHRGHAAGDALRARRRGPPQQPTRCARCARSPAPAVPGRPGTRRSCPGATSPITAPRR